MFHCQKRLFVTVGWKVINPHIYCKSILAAILDYKFSTNGILLDFTMSFSIICLYTLNKNEIVTNLLNVYLVFHLIVLDVMSPVERYWYRHLVSTDYMICIILSRVHVVMFSLWVTCFQGQEHMYMTRFTTFLDRK